MPDRLAPRLADSFVCAGRPLYTTTYVSDITLYSIRSSILSQWSGLRTGVMRWCFGVLVRARARACILNSLEAVYLGDVYVQEEIMAVV